MARLPRLDLAGVAQHVVQRGNNRLPCFLDDADRRCYLRFLREALLASGCDLHAYVLMNNHVHMLMTPPEVGAVARLVQMLGRSYVGRDDFRRMVEAKTQRFAGIRAAHRSANSSPLARK